MVLALRLQRLERRLGELPSLLVALSGGVDSAVLLAAARRSVRGPVIAATTSSPAVPEEEVEDARRVASLLGVPHRVVVTREMDDAEYVANRGDRCYFCRREMYGVLGGVAREEGLSFLADGLQADDDAGDRPGVRAASQAGVLDALREAGVGKAAGRRLGLAFGRPAGDQPAQPCLASRLPAGIAVTADRLALVHRAERAVRALGFSELRVRCEDDHGRIEIGRAQLGRAMARRAELERAVRDAGFRTAAVDPAGYRAK